jgi:hypothetical protein
MKKSFLLLVVLVCLGVSVVAQDKKSNYSQLVNLKGTDCVVTTYDNFTKMVKTDESMSVINTKTLQTVNVKFPIKIFNIKVKQARVKAANFNTLIVSAQQVDANKIIPDSKTVLFMVSTDGLNVRRITDANFFPWEWVFNKETCTLVVTGQTDSNKNGRLDNYDKNDVIIYDLKAQRRIK